MENMSASSMHNSGLRRSRRVPYSERMDSSGAVQQSRKRILIIDDDELVRQLLCMMVESEGFIAEALDSGDAALALLTSAGFTPDVILADLQMAGICGTTLAIALRALCPSGTPVFAMSGSEPRGDAASGYDGFFLKPFDLDELLDALAPLEPVRQPVTSASSSGELDEAVFQRLLASMPRENLRQLCQFAMDDIAMRTQRMRSACTALDAGTLHREAHAMKGGCAMIGASELAGIAGVLEIKAASGYCPGDLEELELATYRLQRILNGRTS